MFYEEEYPSILFAKDGEIFDLNGKQTVVMGGAYSIDKAIRIAYGCGVKPYNTIEIAADLSGEM